MRRTLMLSIALLVCTASLAHAADEYPARAVRVVVAVRSGGRHRRGGAHPRASAHAALEAELRRRQPARGLRDSRADLVAKAKPTDTRCSSRSPPVLEREADQQLPYDPIADFAPVALRDHLAAGDVSCILRVPATDLKEFNRLRQGEPGEASTTVSSGPGSSAASRRPSSSWSMAGIQMTHIPYKGIAPANHRPTRERSADVPHADRRGHAARESRKLRALASGARSARSRIPTCRR